MKNKFKLLYVQIPVIYMNCLDFSAFFSDFCFNFFVFEMAFEYEIKCLES